MTSPHTGPFSRRTVLGRGTAVAAALGIGGGVRHTTAGAQSSEMESHPMVGTWLVGQAPNDLVVTHVSPDGNFFVNGPNISVGADGALGGFGDPPMGSWVPVNDREIHFVFTNRTYDATGAHTGYFSVEGYPVASEDGMSLWDDGTRVTITVRDPNGVVVETIGPGLEGAAISGMRLVPGKSGYDEMLALLAAQQTATPEASPTS